MSWEVGLHVRICSSGRAAGVIGFVDILPLMPEGAVDVDISLQWRGTLLCRKKEIPLFLQGLRVFAPETQHEVAGDLSAGERCGLFTD